MTAAIQARPTGGRRARLQGWPSEAWLGWFDRRLAVYVVALGVANGLLCIGFPAVFKFGWDFDIYWRAAQDVAAGHGAYAATLAIGADQWGPGGLTYVYPPFLAYVLAPFSSLPAAVGLGCWTIAGCALLYAAIRALPPEATVRRYPRLLLGLGTVWITLFLGQVNVVVLAGLLLAVGSRDDRLAGVGLALAALLRVTPAAFGLLFILDGRWRALVWAAGAGLLGALVGVADWPAYVGILRTLAGLPPVVTIWQTSLAAIAPPLAVLAAAAVVAVIVLAGRRPSEAHLIRGTAVGVGLLLVPATSWFHWAAFAIAPLLVDGGRVPWGRRALLGFLAAGWLLVPLGSWATTLVASVLLGVLAWKVIAAPDPARLPVRRRSRDAGARAVSDGMVAGDGRSSPR